MEGIEEINFDLIMENLACSTFHMNDEEAKPVIDKYLEMYPQLLNIHDKEWYYKYC